MLAAVTVVTALSLDRVFSSSRWLFPVVIAAVLPHAIGWIGRRLRRPAWLLIIVSGSALLAFLVLRVALTPHAGTVLDAFRHQLDAGWQLLRTEPAPASATNGAILLACIAVWIVALLGDWLAFTRRATLGALAPALVFFVWTSALGTTGGQVAGTAAYCLAAGAFLVAQNLAVLDRRRSWLVTKDAARARWLVPAAVLGSAAIVVALVLAPALPGAGGDPVIDFANPGRTGSGGRSYRPSLAPFLDINEKLNRPDDVELFTVKSRLPDYWRIAALDTYAETGGGQWTLSASGDGKVSVGLPDTPPAGTLVQQFVIRALGERWLPAAYRPVAVNLDGTLVVVSSGTLVTDRDSVSGLDYTVASSVPVLRATAEQQAATAAKVRSDVAPYTALPPDVPDEIAATARQIVAAAGATTPYDKARALWAWFRTAGFAYDTSVDTNDSGNAIVAFLHNKRGFCVQFSSAYAVMARSLDIPARVAVGFTPGTLGADGRYHVTAHDAHAWPEIWLSGLGWTHMFDPTPPAAGGTLAGGSALPGDRTVGGADTPATTTTVPQTTPTALPGGTTPAGGGTGGTGGGARPSLSAGSSSSSGPWFALLALVLAAVALVGAYVLGVRMLKRRRRTRRRDRDDPAAAVQGAWEEALDRLREARADPDPALTPLELARAAAGSVVPEIAPPLAELADTYTVARYGDRAVDTSAADAAWASVAVLERTLDAHQGARERWRRKLDVSVLTRRRG
jgi:transglutaminase-like putative cysteine protease